MARIFVIVAAVISELLISAPGSTQPAKPDWVVSVILPEAVALDAVRLSAALKRRVGVKDRLAGADSADKMVLLRIGGGTAMVSLMERPIPREELQRECRLAWYWPEACDTVNDHKAHFLVVLMGTELDKRSSALIMTKIVAALIEVSNATASYWGVNLQSRDTFLQESAVAAAESLPVTLWVAYRISREPSGNFSLSTRGLREFDLMEIEAKDAKMPGAELYDLVVGTTKYLIEKGPVIKDRDTIGHSATQHIRVRHAESYWSPGNKVYRIELSGAAP